MVIASLIIVLVILLLISLFKQFAYYSALLGVLWHIYDYNIEISLNRLREIQADAGTRLVEEFLHSKKS